MKLTEMLVTKRNDEISNNISAVVLRTGPTLFHVTSTSHRLSPIPMLVVDMGKPPASAAFGARAPTRVLRIPQPTCNRQGWSGCGGVVSGIGDFHRIIVFL